MTLFGDQTIAFLVHLNANLVHTPQWGSTRIGFEYSPLPVERDLDAWFREVIKKPEYGLLFEL